MDKKLLSTEQVAAKFGVSIRTVQKWIHKDKIIPEAFKLGRDWVIPASALDGFEKPKRGRPAKDEQ